MADERQVDMSGVESRLAALEQVLQQLLVEVAAISQILDRNLD